MRQIQFTPQVAELLQAFPSDLRGAVQGRLTTVVAQPWLAPSTVTEAGMEFSLEWTPTDLFVTRARMPQRSGRDVQVQA